MFVAVAVTLVDLNSQQERAGCPVDMMVFVIDSSDRLVAFSEQREGKGVRKLAISIDAFLYQPEFGNVYSDSTVTT